MSSTQPPYVINLNPGPAKIPPEVLRKAQQELLYYADTGISVMETSHRSPEFDSIVSNTEQLLRELMNIPANYKVLFMHGGGTAQFASVPLNLCPKLMEAKANYVITGTWSEKAAKEAEKYIKVNRVYPKPEKFTRIPDRSTWNIDEEAQYLFYTENETIHGMEYQYTVEPVNERMPVVIDMTSNFCTRPVNVSNYGVIIAGTQKNVGISGLAIVIVREDLIGNPMTICPSVLDYKVLNAARSLYNTPPTFAIYMCGLFLQWIKDQGGLEEMGRRATERAKLVYDVVDASNGFYSCAIEPGYRSRVNASFRVGGPDGDAELEKQFLAESKEHGILGAKGHRLVGGIRISMFNAMPVKDAQTVANFMKYFMAKNRK